MKQVLRKCHGLHHNDQVFCCERLLFSIRDLFRSVDIKVPTLCISDIAHGTHTHCDQDLLYMGICVLPLTSFTGLGLEHSSKEIQWRLKWR